MTPRTFWTIVVKIMGLCIGYSFFTTLWRTINIVITYATFAEFYKDPKLNIYASDGDIAEWSSLVLVILYILIFYCFFFKTQWVIDKLKLDKGYVEQKFELSISHFTVLKISIITIGGWLILMTFPDLIHETFSCFWEPTSTRKTLYNRNIIYMVTGSIKIIIGIFMIIKSESISNFMDRKSKNII